MEHVSMSTFCEPDMVWQFRSAIRSIIASGRCSCNVPMRPMSGPLWVRQVTEAAETVKGY